jgi:regulatory protein
MGTVNSGDPNYRNALKSALRVLARRDHSVSELVRKLARRGFEKETIRQVVAECGRLGYLDDRRVAGQLIVRMQRKGLGLRRIRHELEKRGVDEHQTIAQLWAAVTPEHERSLARLVALKKWKTLAGEEDPQRKMLKLQRFLRYRGFSDPLIIEVLKEMPT